MCLFRPTSQSTNANLAENKARRPREYSAATGHGAIQSKTHAEVTRNSSRQTARAQQLERCLAGCDMGVIEIDSSAAQRGSGAGDSAQMQLLENFS